MPVISMFYGVIVLMYYFDNRRHNLPHVHRYGEEEAVLGIPEGEIIEGELPSNKLKLVRAWIEIHHEELMANWELAINGQIRFQN
ncbi:MAG: DUF4160 domain-containing protein [Pyrinomonadaceae bacterium]